MSLEGAVAVSGREWPPAQKAVTPQTPVRGPAEAQPALRGLFWDQALSP